MCSASQQSPPNSGSAPSPQHPVPTQNLGVESLSPQALVLGVNVLCDFQRAWGPLEGETKDKQHRELNAHPCTSSTGTHRRNKFQDTYMGYSHTHRQNNVLSKHLKEFHGSLNGDIIYIIEL